MLRDRRGPELTFAGYPVKDKAGPCPGGTAYKALHPSLRTPVVLRKFEPDAFAPTDTPAAVVGRARAFGTLAHPNLVPILDAGENQGRHYVVLEQPTDALDVVSLLKEVGGAMPGFLAAEYGWFLASALRAVHERGGWHGEVRPGLLLVGPLVLKPGPDGQVRRRPAPNATAKLTETGLTPFRPPAAIETPDADALPYLPPERVGSSANTPCGDVYGLGATLYLLLTGRPPFTGDAPADVLNKVRSADPVPLAALRPDLPAGFAAVLMRMMAKRPEDRIATASEVQSALAPFCRPGTLPPTPVPVVPHAVPVAMAVPVAQTVPVATAAEAERDAWGVNPDAFAEAQAASVADLHQPRRRQMSAGEKSRSKMWIVLGLCLHLTAVALLIGWFTGAFDNLFSPSKPAPTEKAPDKPRDDPNRQQRPK
jgi:serine/threonine protein kinase